MEEMDISRGSTYVSDEKQLWQLWRPAFAVLGTYWILGFCIALIAPTHVGSTRPWVQEFVHFMSSIVPSINAFSGVSEVSGAARFYFSVMWALLLPTTLLACITSPSRLVRHVTKRQRFLAVPVGLVCMALVVYGLFFKTGLTGDDLVLTGGRGRAALTFMSSSRLGLAIWASVMMAGMSLILVTMFSLVKLLFVMPLIGRFITPKERT